MEIKYIKTIDSTNDELHRLAGSGFNDDLVLVSEEQTKGKGRRGRSFYSPSGTGIYLSFLLHPDVDVEKAQDLTTIMAAAAAVAIEKVSGQNVSIKWVNDLLIHDKKISGILTECSPVIKNGIPEYVIVGIGINVFEPDECFSDDIKNTAGVIFEKTSDITAKDEIRKTLTGEVIKQFLKFYEEKSYIEEYEKRLSVIGKHVDLLSPDHKPLNKKAYVIGINNKCHLHVRYEDGTEDYLSNGEISILY